MACIPSQNPLVSAFQLVEQLQTADLCHLQANASINCKQHCTCFTIDTASVMLESAQNHDIAPTQLLKMLHVGNAFCRKVCEDVLEARLLRYEELNRIR
jgi:hypothetical protein